MTQVSAEKTLQIALNHHQAGRLPEAEAIYRDILAHHPDHADTLNSLAVLETQAGNNEAAAELLNKAVSLQPNDPVFHSNLGECYRRLGKLDQAIASFRRAIELKNDYADPWYNLGLALAAQGRFDQAIASYNRAIELRPFGSLQPYNNLGNILQKLKRFEEAVACYRRAILIAPKCSVPYLNLGLALEGLGKTDEAIAALTQGAQCLDATDEIRFHLASLTGITPPTSPPSEIVKLFDDTASTFDHHLVNDLQYRPKDIYDAVLAASLSSSRPSADFGDVLDLGCGTGLCGLHFKPCSRTLTGVDLSPGMLEKARQRNIYNELVNDDLVAFLRSRPLAFDLAIAADVFIYVGELTPVFTAVASALRPGGLFAFSVELLERGDFVLCPTRRYAHSESYLRRLAGTFRFTPLSVAPAPIRLEKLKQVPGLIVVLQKPKETGPNTQTE